VKAVFVSKDPKPFNTICYHFTPLTFDIRLVTDPCLLVESVKREAYDLIIVNTMDFPRHWKPIIKLVREYYTKEQTVFILLVSGAFSMEEAAKALFLGVNGLVNINLTDRQEIMRLEEIFKRYHIVSEKRRFNRIVPDTNDVFRLLFTLPGGFVLIPGIIMDISIQGAMFKPFQERALVRLKKGSVVNRCSLKLGDTIISLACKITRVGDTVGLEFTSFDEDAHHQLFKYLMERSERKLKSL
jgi:hypothetical protein